LTFNQCKKMSRDADLAANTNLSIFTHDNLDAISDSLDSLDSRLRAAFNWQTPVHMYAQTLARSNRPQSDPNQASWERVKA